MKKFDLQDALLLVGLACVVGGVAMWSRPAALILFGVLCLSSVCLLQGRLHKAPARGIRGVEKRQAS